MNKHILLLFSLVLLIFVFYRVITKTTWKFWLWNIREGMEDPNIVEENLNNAEPKLDDTSSATPSQGREQPDNTQEQPTQPDQQEQSSGWGDLIQAASQPMLSTQDTAPTSNAASCMDYKDSKKLPLREYAIKASYNSAYDGNRITEDQLATIIYNGSRFIDLNVFYADDKLYVGYAVDNNPTTVDTSLPFSVAISYILRYAFVVDPNKKKKPLNEVVKEFEENPAPNESSIGISENYIEYPLFIHIRIYRPENSSLDIIEKVAEYMKVITDSPYYLKESNGSPTLIDGNTPLCQVQRKFIVSMDVRNIVQIYTPSSTPSADHIPQNTLTTLRKFVNILTGGHTWRAYYNYGDVLSMNKNILRISNGGMLDNADTSGKKTSVKNMYIVYPYINDKENVDSLELIKNYSIQTIPNRFYIQDGNLDKYNAFFENARKPFVPLNEALLFISKTETPENA